MKLLAHGHRLLRLVRPVVAVLDSDPVPMDGGLEIAFVDDVAPRISEPWRTFSVGPGMEAL